MKKVLTDEQIKIREVAEQLRTLKLKQRRKTLVEKMRKHSQYSKSRFPVWLSGFGDVFNFTKKEALELLKFIEGLK